MLTPLRLLGPYPGSGKKGINSSNSVVGQPLLREPPVLFLGAFGLSRSSLYSIIFQLTVLVFSWSSFLVLVAEVHALFGDPRRVKLAHDPLLLHI